MSNTAAEVQTNTPLAPPMTVEDYQVLFGKGRYFSIQCEVFKDVRRVFGLEPEHAITVTKAVATSLGSIFSRSQASLKGLDKPLSKDGQVKTISETCKIKGLPLTNEVALLRALDYINKDRSFHVNGHFEPVGFLGEWIDSLKS